MNQKERETEAAITEVMAYFFARCTTDLEVRELEDKLSDIIEQERENRLHELKN